LLIELPVCRGAEFAEYVAVSPVSDDDEDSDECSVYDHAEVDDRHLGRRLRDHLREAKEFIRR
jgi:hypothetical protein